ncbi:hypothetical protein [Bacteriophage sp.]|nr:hypothetical protein [Bacteriophage sp.]
MALTKNVLIDKIEVVENGIVQVRERTDVLEDGNVLSSSFHRWTLTPGQDLAGQADNVKAIATAAWTQEVIAAYEAQEAANLAKLGA